MNWFLEKERVIINPLRDALRQNGIDIPDTSQPGNINPRTWLIRSESNKNRLLDENQQSFHPNAGQMGSHGVFLGDCLAPIMYPNPGAYYVFDTSTVGTKWLPIPSESYIERVNQISIQYSLKVEKIGDGIMAENILFRRLSTYQHHHGIASVPYPISLDKVNRIFLTKAFLTNAELASLQTHIKKKIVIFLPNK